MPALGQATVALTWGEERLRELCRLRAVLERAGIKSELELGLSDEGDPWCVFYRPRVDRVLAHFALIDGEYIGDWPGLRRVVRSNQLGDVIEQFLQMMVADSFASPTTGRHESPKFQ
jgi:hypothetical protein